MRALLILPVGLVALSALASADPVGRSGSRASNDLAGGVRLEAEGGFIDVDIGHAAPFVVDWDGDGLQDLLVGQFGSGQLRIYQNTGEARAARLAAPTWFEVEGKRAEIPAG